MKLKLLIAAVLVFIIGIAFTAGFKAGQASVEIPDVHTENEWYINKILEWVPPSHKEEPNLLLVDPKRKEPFYKLQPKPTKEELYAKSSGEESDNE